MQNIETTLLDINQVARYLNVSPRTVRRLMKVKNLPHLKVGSKLVRYNKSQIDKWLINYSVERDYA
jgi:excisionase family DNA binding protein|tara:strand:+ start:268 stop:465 length:198 start_codon:yes stop_codon:yes gene_type:complete